MAIDPSEVFGIIVVLLLMAVLYELDMIRHGVEKTRHLVIRDYTRGTVESPNRSKP